MSGGAYTELLDEGDNALPLVPAPTNGASDAVDGVLSLGGTAPAAPAITGIATDSGASATDGITADRTLIVSGTAEANSRVDVYRGGTAIGTVTASASGVWSLDYTGTTLAEGLYSFTASATNSGGPSR